MPWAAAAVAVGTVASSAIGASAAGDAANSQIQASQNANNAILGGQEQSLNWLKNVYNQTQTNFLPYTQTGSTSLNALSQLLGLPTAAPYNGPPIGSQTFDQIYVTPDELAAAGQIQGRSERYLSDYPTYSRTPQDGLVPASVVTGTVQAPPGPGAPDPNAVLNSPLAKSFASIAGPPPTAPDVTKFAPTFQADPGYQFRVQQGAQAILDNATAVGGVTGNTLKALSDYGQGTASQDFWNQFNAANTAYNFNNQNYWNQYNAFTQDKTSLFNMLRSLSTGGQSAVTSEGQIGAGISGSIANTITGTTNALSNNIIGAGNASAAGTIGTANAIGGGINSLSNNAMLYYLLNNQNTPPIAMNNSLSVNSGSLFP